MALTKVGKKGLQDGALTTTAASAPTVGAKGELFYNTTENRLYVSNGTAWTRVSNDSPSSTGGTVVISTLNEGATFSYNLGTNFTDDANTDAELTYSLESGTLPGGATLPTAGNSAMTGTVGNVSSNTVYTFSIRATDAAGATATQDYQQQINTVAATVTGGTVTIPSVDEGSSASYDVDTNFTYPAGSTFSAYSLLSGTLPSGLSLNTSTGVISGTIGLVSSNTAYNFTIRGTDTDGDIADQAYSWTINNLIVGTGGTIRDFSYGGNNYKVHEFTTSGTFSIPASRSCEILVAAGGGGGGHDHAAAAGAGGLLYGTVTLNGSYNVTIGAGGAYSTTYDSNDGSNSVFGTINATANGGGGGGTNYRAGRTGGSGGGGGSGGAGSSNQGNSGGLTGYGNSGGTRIHSGSQYPTGGGGGAGAVGGSVSSGGGPTAAGGAGKDYSNTFGTAVGDSGWFAGGGGGGHYSGISAITVGAGGSGGGGDGGHTSLNAGDGSANTGGGGGGADRNGSGHSGSGGSGVIIVRYAV